MSRVSCIFSSYFPACYKIVQCFLQFTLRFGLFTESWEEEHFQNLGYFGIIMNIQLYALTACLQLVEVSTAFVFLGRGLLEQDSESQEDQYLIKICPLEHFAQVCHQIAISCVSSYPSQFTACPSYNLILCCICLEVTC